MKRITRKEVVRRFGSGVELWTDIVVRCEKEAYHLTAEPHFLKNGKTRWYRYIESL